MKIRLVGAELFHADRPTDNLFHMILKKIKTMMVPLKIINHSVFGMENRCVLCLVGYQMYVRLQNN